MRYVVPAARDFPARSAILTKSAVRTKVHLGSRSEQTYSPSLCQIFLLLNIISENVANEDRKMAVEERASVARGGAMHPIWKWRNVQNPGILQKEPKPSGNCWRLFGDRSSVSRTLPAGPFGGTDADAAALAGRRSDRSMHSPDVRLIGSND